MDKKPSKIYSILYNLLIFTYILRKIPIISKLWFSIWEMQKKYYNGLVSTNLHGYNSVVPNGHWYLLAKKVYPKFNDPLLSLCREIIAYKTNKLNIVDVGAAIGDTVLFIESRFGSNINKYYCIDGDNDFINLMRKNLKPLEKKCTIIESLISDKIELIPNVEKRDPTTGSATGGNAIESNTLDHLITTNTPDKIDLIKIDIDGFDGKAIGGLSFILTNHKPPIIFEWNPPLFNLVGNSIFQPFEVLEFHGYNKFLWYTNTGVFSHFESSSNRIQLEYMANYCENVKLLTGFHFDIIAVHEDDKLNILSLSINN